MEYVLTAARMKKCDNAAINEYGISALVLMERAALETANVIVHKYGKDIFAGVMAGSGNNGGDGIAIARMLYERGIRVEINMIGEAGKLTDETRIQLEIAKKLGIPIFYKIEHTLYDVIVDAIFGIGLTRDVEGKYKKAIDAINASKAKIVAVDIPSGVNTDNARIMGCAVKADATVTFEYRKIGIMLYPGASYAGEVICVPIGIPHLTVDVHSADAATFTDKETDLKLPERSRSGNKGSFGKVLFVAGSRSMGGACQLAALASYRIGAGMVRVFTARENRESLLRKLPEAIVDDYADRNDEEIITDAERKRLREAMEWADVVAIGPGLSMTRRAHDILRTVLYDCDKPLVMDADALNLLAQNGGLLDGLRFGYRRNDADIVLTPHLGEFARLMKCHISDIKKDMLGACKEFTEKYDVSLVCKDARTVIAKRGKLTYINSSGNDGMATAGSGDVLAGIISGLMAQKMMGFEAAKIGAYAHGLAGDCARDNASSYFIMAHDIIDSLRYLRYGGKHGTRRENMGGS